MELDGTRHVIRARIHTLGGYSAHADQADLQCFVRGMRRVPTEMRIVHRDRDANEQLRKQFAHGFPGCQPDIPV